MASTDPKTVRARRPAVVACAIAAALSWGLALSPSIDALRTTDPEALADAMTRHVTRPDAAPDSAVNPEWDLMTRTFTVLALANEAIAHPGRRIACLDAIDRIIATTVEQRRAHGMHRFLLPYARHGQFRDPEAASLFVDGEIALMLAARHHVEMPSPEAAADLRARIDRIAAAMTRGPVLSAESYPNECWTFCNTTALAAIAVADDVLGDDHSALTRAWVAMAKRRLVDPNTGLLVSSYTYDGEVLDGPEGSSLWMVAHNLLVIDPAFGREQYDRARSALVGEALGFSWAREWPDAQLGSHDVDSGPVVPGLQASPGSSGLALLGATAFDDHPLRDGLLRSLELAAFPIRDAQGTHYAAAGPVGNAVVLYALRTGPLWRRVRAEDAP